MEREQRRFFYEIKKAFAQEREEWEFAALSAIVFCETQKDEMQTEEDFKNIPKSNLLLGFNAIPIHRVGVFCTVCCTRGKEEISISSYLFENDKCILNTENALFYYDTKTRSITITTFAEKCRRDSAVAIIKIYDIRGKS